MSFDRTPSGRAFSRRDFLRATALAGAGGALAGSVLSLLAEDTITMPFVNGERPLVQYPQKRPLIRLTTRPPQLETPFSVFNQGMITPNDAFFVRYHVSEVPTEIDEATFRIAVKGKVNSALSLSITELKSQFEPAEIVAVNQCSGNGRGYSSPRVSGGQMGNGAMGNAKWKGARLKDVLNKAGVAAGAKQVVFDGLDRPVNPKTPDFVKSLELDHALDGEVMLAYEMNSEPLPLLNGFPVRLVVPGWFGTYWIKHLNDITVVDDNFTGFWMSTAYRIPDNDGACIPPGTTATKTRPIGRFNVRSFITSLTDDEKINVGEPLTVRGIAFDGGHGIRDVMFSDDGGKTWRAATLGKDFGNYSFREWTIAYTPRIYGPLELECRATNRIGQSQPLEPLWNPAGYMRNVVETVRVTAI